MAKPITFPGDSIGSISSTLDLDLVIEDFQNVLRLSDEDVTGVRQAMEAADGFLSPTGMRELLARELHEPSSASGLARILYNLVDSPLAAFLASVEKSDADENAEPSLSSTEWQDLKERLEVLVHPYPGLIRYKKAELIAGAVGQPLEDLQLISELRPVFDEDREQIEGMIPCTRLKVVAEGEDGRSQVMEVQLIASQLEDLEEKVKKARQKLEKLDEHVVQTTRYGLPDLPGAKLSTKIGK